MRVLLGVWFLLHGIAHVPGVLVAWRLRTFSGLPFRTTVFADTIDVGVVGMRVIGLGWLVAGTAFAALAVAAVLQVSWWTDAAYGVLLFSFALCVIGWPRSWIGAVSNAAVAALLSACGRFGWL